MDLFFNLNSKEKLSYSSLMFIHVCLKELAMI